MSLNGSASGAERLIACAPSVVLPQAHWSSQYTARGHTLHGFTRNVMTGIHPDIALARLDEEHRATAKAIQWSKLGGDLHDVRSEVAYAIDPFRRTARELGVDIQRRYHEHGITPDELPGSNDLEGTRIDDVPVIVDLKFGWERVTAAEENAQLHVFAAAKAWMLNVPEVEVRIAYVRPSGKVELDSATIGRLEIDCFADEVEDAIVRSREMRRRYLAGGPVDVNPGPHCRWCGGMENCSAYTSLARSMLSDLSDVEARLTLLTPEQAGNAYNLMARAALILERVENALKARAKQEPIPVADGKVLRAISYPQAKFSQTAAVDLLKTKGASEEELAGLYTIAQVEQVRVTNVPGQKAPKKKRVKAVAA